MLSSYNVDDTTNHDFLLTEANFMLGIDEFGANGGFGDYWTNGEDSYNLKERSKLLEYYKKYGSNFGLVFHEDCIEVIKPKEGKFFYPDKAMFMEVNISTESFGRDQL